MDSLLKLPTGASYYGKSGQANAEVSINGDTIYVTSSCDSLARQVEYYESLYNYTKDALEAYHNITQEEFRQQTSPIRIFVTGLGLGFLTCIIFIVLLYLKMEK